LYSETPGIFYLTRVTPVYDKYYRPEEAENKEQFNSFSITVKQYIYKELNVYIIYISSYSSREKKEAFLPSFEGYLG
jgi:hypothetical protein